MVFQERIGVFGITYRVSRDSKVQSQFWMKDHRSLIGHMLGIGFLPKYEQMMFTISWLRIEFGYRARFWIHGTLFVEVNGVLEF